MNATTYNPRQTPVHKVDARVKILLVLAFSIALFFVNSWWGIGVFTVLAIIVGLLAHLDVPRIARTLLPVAFILVVTLLANTFVFDVNTYDPAGAPGAVSAGVFETMPAIPLIGSFGFAPAGFVRGCYYVLRIVLLLTASLILTTTSSSTEITQALSSFLRPLKRIGVPTHDIATVVSIALRFIPVSIDEFRQVRIAQTARGAGFNTGKLMNRLKVWTTVLVPLFVGLFRRADNLALAMDARCYGSADATHLTTIRFTAFQAMVLVVGVAICIVVGVLG